MIHFLIMPPMVSLLQVAYDLDPDLECSIKFLDKAPDPDIDLYPDLDIDNDIDLDLDLDHDPIIFPDHDPDIDIERE
jgi:hypothetical protein